MNDTFPLAFIHLIVISIIHVDLLAFLLRAGAGLVAGSLGAIVGTPAHVKEL